jgi:prevent-host-death family protein
MTTSGAAGVETMTESEARQSFGRLLDTVLKEPVGITRNGKVEAVVLSRLDYEYLDTLEQAGLGWLATWAENEGYLGVEESEECLKSYL